MKFSDLTTTEEILAFFDSSEIKDFNLIYKFHKTYKNVVLAMVEPLSGYGYLKDIYELYIKFYAEKEITYNAFSKIVTEMEEANLVASLNAKPKVIYMKPKGYQLLNGTTTSIHHSRLNNITLDRSHLLTKMHLWLKRQDETYSPEKLITSTKNRFIFSYISDNQYYLFNVLGDYESRGSRALIKSIKDNLMDYISALNDYEMENHSKLHLNIMLISSHEQSKMLNTVVTKLKSDTANASFMKTAHVRYMRIK